MTNTDNFLRCPSCLSSNITCDNLSGIWACLDLDCLWEGEEPDLLQEGDFLDGSDEITEVDTNG